MPGAGYSTDDGGARRSDALEEGTWPGGGRPRTAPRWLWTGGRRTWRGFEL